MSRVFLQAPAGRRYVRSFLFSRRIDAPLANVHLLARTALVLCLSAVQLHSIDTLHPDTVAAALLFGVSLLLFAASGMNRRLACLYLLLTLPALLSLFTTWVLFNPVAGSVNLLHVQVAPFSHPLTVLVSDHSLLVAVSKVLGYGGMVLITAALVVTSRDAELIGAFRQLRVPQAIIFFLSTVFRALEMAWSDYETIRLAQLARAINARPRSFVRRLRDLGSIAVPMVAMMIRRSSEIGDALTARGYRVGQGGTDFYETSRWRGIDWAILALSLLCLGLAFLPHWNLTTLVVGR
ncbi:MAG: energy-coupling factor transporter transmembrane protein EcfT [Ktedonobacteraceae bacterium]|nr:energy-coupling factor transporter transmembrane protein EcfT [Ktedonobacteraceae bacterium]